MVENKNKRAGVALNQALELMAGVLPAEFESWDEVPANYQSFRPELLRTPKASDGEGGALGEAEALKRRNSVGVRDQVMDLVAAQGAKVSRANLPTPTVADTFTDNLKSSQQKDGSMHSVNLSQAVHLSFGKFEPAVKRWEETLGVVAPAPTEPDGRDGAHRLSSKFTEWMMGLNPGWVTGHGLSRKDELKLCGNGVVPQQAKLALAILKKRLDVVA